MKKIVLASVLFLSAMAFTRSEAQVRLNVNVNIGSQPNWGPAGYDYVEYYYLPDIEAYYYVPRHQFVYLSGGNWVFSSGLPPAYRSYNLYSGYKVVVNQPNAYRYYPSHKVKYARYRGHGSQVIIRDNPHYKPKHHGNGKGHKRGHH